MATGKKEKQSAQFLVDFGKIRQLKGREMTWLSRETHVIVTYKHNLNILFISHSTLI